MAVPVALLWGARPALAAGATAYFAYETAWRRVGHRRIRCDE